MESTKKPALHPELLKVFNSRAYSKKIKRMVESAKALRGIHRRLPKKSSNPLTLDRQCIHFFAQRAGFDRGPKPKTVSPNLL